MEFNRDIEKTIRKYLKLGEVFNPLTLCELMISKVPKEGMKFVIHNLELIYMMRFTGHDMNTIWFASDSAEKVIFAGLAGVIQDHCILYTDIRDLKIKLKERNVKFKTVIMNPPYNPNAIWEKFVQLVIEYVKDDGRMIVIHPSTWRESSTYDKLAEILKCGIIELHMMDFDVFKENKIDIKTDWYVWQKNYTGNQTVYLLNGTKEIVDLRNCDMILPISQSSPPSTILEKILQNFNSDNNMINENGFNEAYNAPHNPNGKYKQCGGAGNLNSKGKKPSMNTTWIDDNFKITDLPTKYQFEDKVVMSYTGRPRARFFSVKDEVGVSCAHYWLTDNKSLPILLNSKMLWKIMFSTMYQEGTKRHKGGLGILHPPVWILRRLNFYGLNVTTEKELYKHYDLTDEEIKWCES